MSDAVLKGQQASSEPEAAFYQNTLAWPNATVVIVLIVLMLRGRLKVYGWRRAARLMWRGGVILAPNHLSLLESFALPGLFWALSLLRKEVLPWTATMKSLFPEKYRWLYGPFRCILVEYGAETKGRRISQLDREAVRSMERVLETNGNLVIYSEEGRLCKAKVLVYHEGRYMRKLRSAMPSLAKKKRAVVVPVRIELGEEYERPLRPGEKPPTILESLMRLSLQDPMQIYFGDPFCFFRGTLHELNRDLEIRILSTDAVGT